MAKNEAKVKFTAETGEFNKAIQQSNREMSELRAEFQLNETQMKAAGTTVEGLENRHSILEKQLKASHDKTEALNQKVQKAAEIFGENSAEASKLRVQLLNAQTAEEKMRQAVEQCGKELEEQRNAANEAESAMESLTDKISRQESELKQLKTAYVNAVDQYGEASDEARTLAQQIENLSGDLVKNRDAYKTTADAADLFDKTLKSAEDTTKQTETAIEKLSATIEEQKSELDQLKQEYQNAVLEHGKLSKEARTLAKEIKAVSSDLDDNQKAMNRLETAADQLDASMDNVDKTAEKVSESFTVMKGAAADLLADGIEGLISGFSEVASSAFILTNDIDKATNTFIAKTGESAANAEEFEDVMVNIYNGNYGESFDDIAESMSSVKTTMGDIGSDELEKLTTDALVLRDTFDLDVNESIRAVNSLMDQFGITGDEAYSLIAQGAQNGLNQNGDLLDVVNEYAVQFKNAGFGASDMFNMLSNGAATGTWSVDKLGDAVKEFNIRASDGTVSTAITENAKAFGLSKKEAQALAAEVESGSVGSYQKLADKLREVDDDTQRYQLGVSMFGTMWEDLGEEAVLALLDTQGEVSLTKDALDEINAVKYDDLGSAFEGIKRNLETSVAEPIKENVMPAVNEFIEDVDWQGVGDTIGQAFGAVIDGAFELVNIVKESIQWMNEHKAVVAAVATVIGILTTAITAYNVVQGIKSAMDAAQVTTVWGLVAAHWAQAAAAMAAMAPYILIVAAIAAVIAIIVLCIQYWDEIVAAVKKCWDSIMETLSQWGEWINTNVIQPIVNFFKNLWSGITEIFSNIGGWFKEKWNSAKEAVVGKVNEIKESASEKFESMKSAVSEKFSAIKETMGNVMQAAKDTVSEKLSNIKNAYNEHGGGIKGIAAAAMEGIKGYYNAGFSFVDKLTGGKLSAISDKFKNGMSKVKSAVSNAFSNVKNSISNGLSSAFSAVTSKLNSIKDKFSNIFESVKNAVSNAISKIKSIFSNLKLKLPDIKLPHFSVTGKFSLNPISVPKLSIQWYKEGAIFAKPTIFNTPFGMKGVGEAGAEAVLPIEKLESYISGAIEKAQTVVNLNSLANAIEDLANRPVQLNINGRQFAHATASATDSVGGLRSTFKSRGLAVD